MISKVLKILTQLIIAVLLSQSLMAQTGKIKGKVINKLTGEPVPFANILIDGTNKGTTTDIEGNFTLDDVPVGFVRLRVSFIGFKEKLTEEIFVSKNNSPFVTIEMEESSLQLEAFEVKADPFQKSEEALISMQSIGVKEIESNPGSNRDISRVIQSFPGVGSTPAFRNDVIIRGGGPSENRFYLDDIEIPVLNHFSTQGASGGPVGIINADFIREVNFYSSNFPAKRYNALSGVLDFKLKEGSKDKTNIQFTLGASETAITLDGPIGKKTTYIVSVRRSYLQLLFSALGLPFLPTFNDYQFKIKTDLNAKSNLTIISLGSLDFLKLNTGIKNPSESQEYILNNIPVNNQWSYTIGAVYKRFTGKGYQNFIVSRNMLFNSLYKYPENDESKPKVLDYNSFESENKFRYENITRSGEYKISFGFNAEYAHYQNVTNQALLINNNVENISYETDIFLWKYGMFGQLAKSYLSNRLQMTFGLRMDGMDYNPEMANLLNQFSPRLAASYVINEKDKLNAGIGRYFQHPAYTTLGFKNNRGEFVNKDNLKFIGMIQYNLGIERSIKEGVMASVEGFYKDYFQYPIDLITGISLANQGAGYGVVGAVPAASIGKGYAYGIEVLNRWSLNKFSLLATYTWVRSSFTGLNGKYIPSSWDSRHLVTITGTKEFKKRWKAGLKWRFVGGLPYTPYDLNVSSRVDVWTVNGGPVLDYNQINSQRFNAFHQLDIRIDKSYFFERWTLLLYLDIQNLYNFQNRGQDFVIREKNPDGTYKTINGGQQYVLKTIPNFSGTVLPTIGIRIKF